MLKKTVVLVQCYSFQEARVKQKTQAKQRKFTVTLKLLLLEMKWSTLLSS